MSTYTYVPRVRIHEHVYQNLRLILKFNLIEYSV